MPVAAILPIRSFRTGKARLASDLTPAARAAVGEGMAQHTVAAAEAAGLLPVIVTSDDEVGRWAVDRALVVVDETGTGLDDAAAAGVAWADARAWRWMILHADLPLVTPGELGHLGDLIELGESVLAPSSDGGTSALSSPEPIDFSYGPLSAHRHLGRLTRPVMVTHTGLLHDVDTTDDLRSAWSHRDGVWLRELVELAAGAEFVPESAGQI